MTEKCVFKLLQSENKNFKNAFKFNALIYISLVNKRVYTIIKTIKVKCLICNIITKSVNFVIFHFYKYFKIKIYINLIINITIFCKRTPVYQFI